MAEAIQYAVLRADGEKSTCCGTLLNLSEGGIYLATENRLEPGASVEIVLPWPARAATSTSVVLHGFVLRSDAVHAAVRIVEYAFQSYRLSHAGTSRY